MCLLTINEYSLWKLCALFHFCVRKMMRCIELLLGLLVPFWRFDSFVFPFVCYWVIVVWLKGVVREGCQQRNDLVRPLPLTTFQHLSIPSPILLYCCPFGVLRIPGYFLISQVYNCFTRWGTLILLHPAKTLIIIFRSNALQLVRWYLRFRL